MSQPYVGQITPFAFDFAPSGWAICNGQLLPISQNQTLFSLLGVVYGGDGNLNFALPNLQGRFSLSQGSNTGIQYALGQQAGEANHTLLTTEMPKHIHIMQASGFTATATTPVGNYPSTTPSNFYSKSTNTSMGTGSTMTGADQPHMNMQPYLALTFCIALTGIYPSHN